MDSSTLELPGASHGAIGRHIDGMMQIHIYNIYTDGFDAQWDTFIQGSRHTYFNRFYPEYLKTCGSLIDALAKEREKAKHHFDNLESPQTPTYFNAYETGKIRNCLMTSPARM